MTRFSIPLFLSVFAILYLGFYGFIGLTTPGGKIYSPFLHDHLNIATWFTAFISTCAKWLLQISGYDVYQKNPYNVTIQGSTGVNILWACLGVGVMSFWIAFVAAHKNNWRYNLMWILIGVASIFIINILRIALIALAYHKQWKFIMNLEPHTSFNIVTYCFIFLLVFIFIKQYNLHIKRSIINETTL